MAETKAPTMIPKHAIKPGDLVVLAISLRTRNNAFLWGLRGADTKENRAMLAGITRAFAQIDGARMLLDGIELLMGRFEINDNGERALVDTEPLSLDQEVN